MTNYEADEAKIWRQVARDQAENYHKQDAAYDERKDYEQALAELEVADPDYLRSLTEGK